MIKKSLLFVAMLVIILGSVVAALLLIAGCGDKNITHIESYKILDNNLGMISSDLLFRGSNWLVSDTTVILDKVDRAFRHGDTYFVNSGYKVMKIAHDGSTEVVLDRRGRGPGEYSRILDFCLSDDSIFILDDSPKVLEYGMDGTHLKSASLDYLPASICFNSGSLIVTSACQEKVHHFHVLSSSTLKEEDSFGDYSEAELTYRHILSQNNFFQFGESLLYHELMNNTVSRITDKGLYPDKTFDLFGSNAPEEFWNKKYDNVVDIMMKLNDAGYCYGLEKYAESETRILFTYRSGMKDWMCLYDKKNDSSFQFNRIDFKEFGASVGIGDISFQFNSEEDISLYFPVEVMSENKLGFSDGQTLIFTGVL